MPSSTTKSIPTESEWPIFISTSAVINVPRDKVWDTLLDFDSYPTWNPYFRASTLLDHTDAPVYGRAIAVGDHVAMKAHLPPTMDDSIKPRAITETVMHVEPGRAVVWGSHAPGWLFGAEHWYVLTEVGEGRTKFEIIKVFSGVGPWIVLVSLRAPIAAAIKAMAQAIKVRCEKS
ncbi:hypothetical protein DFH07DRAFT_918876 [Mycena maculata]|uniref:Uncharacterized protein n=1 Tax=Mycena maculata TaxID=230809 RepID=A0AAD7J916_9AGAR|nr:hypothetical protein DFH07DRAFT_918876 [Mycena maculata]